MGYKGLGVTVAILDSGVDATHPDLWEQYRGGTNSWFDPFGQHATPFDVAGHGTAVASVAVGRNASGSAIGVAPDALWIAARVFDDTGYTTVSRIHEVLQWVIDPDGNPATNDAPDVVNASWGFSAGACNNEFSTELQLLRAAGIAVVFSAGNSGPAPETSVSPGNTVGALSVGAIDVNDNVPAFSSRGPSICDGAIDPELVAPGETVLTADTSFGLGGSAYRSMSGTSFAAPHVTGALALLLSARPDAIVENLESILRDTARDLGSMGPDNDYGYGALDVFSAMARVLSTEAPIATSDAATTDEDTPVRIAVLANDLDPLGGTLRLVSATPTTTIGGTVALNSDGTITYTPPRNFPNSNVSAGSDRFSYQVGNARSVTTGTVTVTVNPVNDPPVLVNDQFAMLLPDASGNYVVADPGVLANDSDADGDVLVATIETNVASGTVQLRPTGGFTYTPPVTGAPVGNLSFTYRVNDGFGPSSPATVTFSLNHPPIAVDDRIELLRQANGSWYVAAPSGVLANDSDPDGAALTVSLVQGPAIGSISLAPNGAVTYIPPAGDLPTGELSFTYQASDGRLTSRVATVTFVLLNRAPTAVDDTNLIVGSTGTFGQYALAANLSLLANDSDLDGDAITATLVSNVSVGSVTLAANGRFIYQAPTNAPLPNYALSFTYRVSDGQSLSNVATATFTIASPAGSLASGSSASYSSGSTSFSPPPSFNFGSGSGSSFSSGFGSSWSSGSTDNRTAATAGQGANSSRTDANAAAAEQRSAARADATVGAAGSRQNEKLLEAVDDSFPLNEPNERGYYVIDAPGVLANDNVDNKPQVVLSMNVRFGKLLLRPDGGFTYIPPETGMPDPEVTFAYRLRDGTRMSEPATVRLQLQNPLVANPDTFILKTLDAQGLYRVAAPGVLSNDEGRGALRAELVQKPMLGDVQLAPDGSFAYRPPAGPMPRTPVTFSYKVMSGKLVSRSATVVLVLPQKLAAHDDELVLATRDAQGRYVLPAPGVLGNDSGSGNLRAILTRNVAQGSVTLLTDGGLLYAPPASGPVTGPLTFYYKVTDGTRSTPEAKATIRLAPAGPARVATQAK